MQPVWLVTGGAGFIGSNFILSVLNRGLAKVINYDKLTYAGNLRNLDTAKKNPNYSFKQGDIADGPTFSALLREFKPTAVINFAAESHVDRSITGPKDFIFTNVVGTFTLLEAFRAYYGDLNNDTKKNTRFVHVSTDEVFGSLGEKDPAFCESTPYAPNSPYSASKAGSDHLVRAYFHTYGLPMITTNCSNNYGPYQFPEKLIPLMIIKALYEEPMPVYGDGQNVRDWLYVEDHVDALVKVLQVGKLGETYNIGGNNELKNLDLVKSICQLMDQLKPRKNRKPFSELIEFVKDRPGHDRRYAMDSRKISRELGWSPKESVASGIEKTVRWYLDNESWWQDVRSGKYKGDRLGLV